MESIVLINYIMRTPAVFTQLLLLWSSSSKVGPLNKQNVVIAKIFLSQLLTCAISCKRAGNGHRSSITLTQSDYHRIALGLHIRKIYLRIDIQTDKVWFQLPILRRQNSYGVWTRLNPFYWACRGLQKQNPNRREIVNWATWHLVAFKKNAEAWGLFLLRLSSTFSNKFCLLL